MADVGAGRGGRRRVVRGRRGRGGARGGRGRGGARGGRGGGAGGERKHDNEFDDGSNIIHDKSGAAAAMELGTDGSVVAPRYDSVYMRALFLRDAKLQQHVDALKANREIYNYQLKLMIDRKVALHFTAASKARILAACLCTEAKQTVQNHKPFDYRVLRAARAAAAPSAPGGASSSSSASAASEKKDDGKKVGADGKALTEAEIAAAAAKAKKKEKYRKFGPGVPRDERKANKAAAAAAEEKKADPAAAAAVAATAPAASASTSASASASAAAPAPAPASAPVKESKEDKADGADKDKAKQLSAAAEKARVEAVVRAPGFSMADLLLSRDDLIGLGEVVMAARLMDSGRKLRVAKNKLAKLEKKAAPAGGAPMPTEEDGDDDDAAADGNDDGDDAAAAPAEEAKAGSGVRASTLARLRTEVNNHSQDTVAGFSLTGARAKRLRKWISSLSAETLEFYALNYPFNGWKELADLVHARKEDFALNYFLSVAFGGAAPEKSVFAAAQNVTSTSLESVLEAYPRLAMCYSYLRKKLKQHREQKTAVDDKIKAITQMGFTNGQARLALQHGPNGGDVQNCVDWLLATDLDGKEPDAEDSADDISPKAREFLAKHAPLETLLWWYEEFEGSKTIEDIAYARLLAREPLNAGNSARSNYGKLMERLLLFREKGMRFAPLMLPYAEERLRAINLPNNDVKVVVAGDASGSMEVAIKCASCLGSLLSAALSADLVFFNTASFAPPVVPRTAADAVRVVETVKADGGTSMAAALWPYYHNRTKLDLFVLVSDEGENAAFQNFMFAPLWRKYKADVNPAAKLVLVSFLRVGEEGTIKQRLNAEGEHGFTQFRLDGSRPDTSKFDALLGLVSLETGAFSEVLNIIDDTLGVECGFPSAILKLIIEY